MAAVIRSANAGSSSRPDQSGSLRALAHAAGVPVRSTCASSRTAGRSDSEA
jgi:hypothetical protein